MSDLCRRQNKQKMAKIGIISDTHGFLDSYRTHMGDESFSFSHSRGITCNQPKRYSKVTGDGGFGSDLTHYLAIDTNIQILAGV